MLWREQAGDGHAVLDLDIANRVASENHRARFDHSLGATAKDLIQHVEIQLIVGESDNVENGFWVATHRIDVAQGIRRGDLAKHKRIVD